MATRITKDTRIKRLEEENKALRRQSLFTRHLETMSTKTRVILMVTLLSLVLSTLLLFVSAFLRASRTRLLEGEAYELLLSEVDGRTWHSTPTYMEALGLLSSGSAGGKARTVRVGETIRMTLEGEKTDTILRFSLKDGVVWGLFGSSPVVLSYSESTRRSGRALTLRAGGRKVVFYEDR